MERTLESRGHLTERQGLGRANRTNVLVHFPRRKRPGAGRADDAGRTDDEGLARLHVPIGNPPGAVVLRGCISQARPSGERRNGAPNFRCPTTRGRISRADGERSIRIVGGAHQSHTWPLPRVSANRPRGSWPPWMLIQPGHGSQCQVTGRRRRASRNIIAGGAPLEATGWDRIRASAMARMHAGRPR